jgi:hypothetical protein
VSGSRHNGENRVFLVMEPLISNFCPSHQILRHPFDLRHVVMTDRVSVAIIPRDSDSTPSGCDNCALIGYLGSPTNAFANSEGSRLLAGHEPPWLWATIILVIVIRRRSRRSHIQFARVERQDRPTLTGNSDKRSVIVHATPPLGRINSTGTSGHLKENQRRSDHECKGHFHWKSFRTRP